MCFLPPTPESQLHHDAEVGEDAVTTVRPSTSPPAMTEEERAELQEELIKVRKGSRGQRSSWFTTQKNCTYTDTTPITQDDNVGISKQLTSFSCYSLRLSNQSTCVCVCPSVRPSRLRMKSRPCPRSWQPKRDNWWTSRGSWASHR